MFENLSGGEKEAFLQALEEVREEKKELSQAKQVREIAPIEKWLESPYYIGKDGMKLYDYWKDELTDIFSDNGRTYNEIIITGCFVGSTEVPLLNGKTKTMKELADEFGMEEKFWVYSVNEKGDIVPGRAHSARKTGKKKEVWYVELDTGDKVYCTPDHRFMKRDGNYIEVQYLEEGDSLMPLYRKYEKMGKNDYSPNGYERVYNPSTEEWKVTHKLVADWKYGNVSIVPDGDYGEVVHHKDFDKKNNIPENLMRLGVYQHVRYHRKHNEKLWENPEYREKMSDVASKTGKRVMKERWEDPEYREMMSNLMKERWESGEMDGHLEKLRKAQREFMMSEEGRKLSLESLSKIDMSEEEIELWKQSISNTMKEIWEDDDERRKEHSERMKRLNEERNLAQKASKKSAKKKVKEFEERTGLTLEVLLEELSNSNSVNQIAKKYEISNSTIYRKLKRNGYPSKSGDLKKAGYLNHKVVDVGFSHYEDVYDFEVDRYHNFMIEPGICVHNSIGTGKSTMSLFTMLRKIYELSCYENVPALFDLMSSSLIVFIYFSITKTQAELTGFGQFKALLDTIPYFQEHFQRNENINSLIQLPESLLFTHGAEASHAIGMNMIGSILDEANFHQGETDNPNKASSRNYSKIANLYSSIVNRGKSRFADKDNDHSLSVLVSSATHSSSFTMQRMEESADDPTTKIINAKLWEVKSHKYSEETFWVFAGSELLDPFVVKDVQDVNEFLESIGEEMVNPDFNSIDNAINQVPVHHRHLFIDVPVDFKKSFETNLVKALQDIAGVSVAPMGKLFTSKPTFIQACNRGKAEGLKHPFYKDEFTISTGSDITIDKYLRDGFIFQNMNKPRYVHIDQSTTNDCTGVSMVHIDRVEEIDGVKKPFIKVDFMLKVMPPDPPKEISIGKIRDFIFYLRDKMNVPIKMVSYDWFGCLTEGYKVITISGMKNIEDIEVGEEVLTKKGYKEVTNTFKYEDAPVKKIITKSGRNIEGTGNHKILAWKEWDYYGKRTPVWEWKRLDKLEIGDIVYTEMLESDIDDYVELEDSGKVVNTGGKMNGFKLPEYLDEELAYIIGYYLGDGHMSGDGISFFYNGVDEASKFHKRVKDYFDYNMELHETEGSNKIKTTLSSRDLIRFLEKNGVSRCHGLNKFIPDIIWKSPKSVIASFVAGLVDTDGSVDKKGTNGEGRIQFTNHSKELIYGLQNLLMMGLGIKSTISHVDNEKYFGSGIVEECSKDGWRLKTVGDRKKLHCIPSWKVQERLSEIKGRNIYDRVIEIEDSIDDVYDIEVEDEHAYYANGFYSHNSVESRQVLNESGIEGVYRSVDKDDEAYLTLIRLFFEERIDLYKYETFEVELFDLIHDRTKRKVDHPQNSSKDVSDAVAGAVMNALEDDISESSGGNDGSVIAEVNSNQGMEDVMFSLEELMDIGGMM